MKDISITRRPFIIGVMGGHRARRHVLKQAYTLGKEIARCGHVLLTGGGGGIMEEASKGAYDGEGLVIGILPSERTHPIEGYPNKYVDIPIYTGMADARNVINAKTPHVIVALEGGPGTLSEIALALKSETPVIGLNCPQFGMEDQQNFITVKTVEGALRKIEEILPGYQQPTDR